MPNALNSGQIRVAGTGAFWKAPLGTTLPTDSVSAWGGSFVNLGYATDGFEVNQDKKTQGIDAWQTREDVRLLTLSLVRKFKFELLQSNQAVAAMAWGGVVSTSTGTTVGGAITIGTGGVLTTATPHGLSIGAPVTLATVTTSTGITALTTYYVIAVGSSTTLTLSTTVGGSALTTTSGTGTGLTPVGAYSIDLPDVYPDFILGIDWNDGVTSQRIIIQQASILTPPTIKGTKTNAVRFPFEVQAIRPADGTRSVLIYGFDPAVAGA
jgi:hypothetical protein